MPTPKNLKYIIVLILFELRDLPLIILPNLNKITFIKKYIWSIYAKKNLHVIN